MWRFTLSQMRRTLPRLVAVGIAIALGTGFISATFLATATLSETTYQSARTAIADADLVISGTSLTDADLAGLSNVDGVAAVEPGDFTPRTITGATGTEYLALIPSATGALERTALVSGTLPEQSGDLAVPEGTADRLGLAVGDRVTVSGFDDGSGLIPSQDMTLVGITADGSGLGFSIPLGLAADADISQWRTEMNEAWGGALLSLDDPANTDAVSSVIEALYPGAILQTGDEYAEETAERFTGGLSVITAMVLAFAAVAIAVAGLVISNTFQVLVAQRTHTLALLRCIGATRRQIRASVRQEALVLGGAASAMGILGGIGIGQATLAVLGAGNDGVPLPTTIPVNLWSIVVPLVVGIVVTLVAANGAARAATKVAPLAALRPVEVADGAATSSARVRVVAGWIIAGVGAAIMAGAVAWTGAADETIYLAALGLGILGGILTLLGVVMASVSFVPAFIRGLGRLTSALGGIPGRLAATNAVRNPGRTASTANALLVGVALVTMMSTGASTARTQMDSMLEDEYAVDVTVWGQEGEPLPAETVSAVTAVDGVRSVALLPATETTITVDGSDMSTRVLEASDEAALIDVVASTDSWRRGVAFADGWLTADSDPAQVGNLDVQLELLPGIPDYTVVLDGEMWDYSGLEATTSALWVALDDDVDPRDAVSAITAAVTQSTSGEVAPVIEGGAVERAGFAQIIDTMLLIVIGLLAIAVVIALIGVANTLSLSVVERRQENALLRALGLTKAQLRATLAWEGVLLALVGALTGVIIGLVFGWAGSYLLLAAPSGASVPLVLPWSTIGIVLVISLIAGVIASVLPARGAVKVPPVVALGA